MSPVELAPEVRAFLAEAGLGITRDEDAVLVGDGETFSVLRRDPRGFVVERRDRGSDAGVDLVTPDPEVLNRFLVMTWAVVWRSHHGLDHLTLPEVPPGELDRVEEGTNRWALRQVDGTDVASELFYSDARTLESALRFPVGTVVEAARRPDGAPVWGAGTTGLAARAELGAPGTVGVSVRAFLEAAGIRFDAVGRRLTVSADGVSWVVEQDGGLHVVRVAEGGGEGGGRGGEVCLRTADPEVLDRFLLVALADVWRARRGLGPLPKARVIGFWSVGRESGRATVRGSDGRRVAWGMDPVHARRLAAAMRCSVTTVMAAVRDRHGLPVWGPWWWRRVLLQETVSGVRALADRLSRRGGG